MKPHVIRAFERSVADLFNDSPELIIIRLVRSVFNLGCRAITLHDHHAVISRVSLTAILPD